jgi:hypothetical protein
MRIRHLSVLIFLFASCLVGSFLACRSAASATPTAAGTIITNLATFQYTDATGTYNGTSNQLSVTVQNVPTMSINTPTGINVTPGYEALDTFILTNTGNSPGIFQLTGAVTFAGGTTTPTVITYIVGTCTQASPCTTYTQANSALTAIGNIAINATQNVGVVYQVLTTATAAQTVQPLLSVQIDYAGGTLLTATNSATATNGAYSDTVIADARLDQAASATVNGTTTITWTVKANDNGGAAAYGLQSAKAALGLSANNGVVMFMQVPYFSGNSQYLTLNTTPAAPTLSAGVTGISTTATWYYNALPCASAIAGGWSTTYSSTSECLAVFLSNSGTTVLPLATGGSGGVGVVGTPEVTATFITSQPSGGTGGGVLGSVNLVASSAIGGYPWMTTGSPLPIVGAPLGIDASMDSSSATALNTILAASTPSITTVAPGGASNQAQSNAASSYSVLVGPFGSAAATGNWSTATFGYTNGSANTSNDFTFVNYDPTPPSINSATVYTTFPTGSSIANGGVATIMGTVQNTGNGPDVFTLTSTSNGNWTVAFNCYNVGTNSCGTSSGAASTCSTVAYASGVLPSIASQATLNFCAAFTPSSTVTSLAAIPWMLTGTSAGTGNPTNTTWDVLYPGGSLVGFRTLALTTCPGPPANGGVVSGCTITYTAYIVNEAPVASGGSITAEPVSSVVVTETGTSTWGVNTGGLTVAPTVTNCTSCTFGTITLGSKAFTVTIPAADLAPQLHPSYTYSVVVN